MSPGKSRWSNWRQRNRFANAAALVTGFCLKHPPTKQGVSLNTHLLSVDTDTASLDDNTSLCRTGGNEVHDRLSGSMEWSDDGVSHHCQDEHLDDSDHSDHPDFPGHPGDSGDGNSDDDGDSDDDSGSSDDDNPGYHGDDGNPHDDDNPDDPGYPDDDGDSDDDSESDDDDNPGYHGDDGNPHDDDNPDDPGYPDGDGDPDDNDIDGEDSDEEGVFLPFNPNIHLNMFTPLHFAAPANVRDAVSLAIAKALRHNLSYEALLDDFRSINALHRVTIVPTNKQALWALIGRDRSAYIHHVYCSPCMSYISERNENVAQYECPVCHTVVSQAKASTFITLKLTRLLTNFLQIPGIGELLNYRDNRPAGPADSMSDIYDGRAYKLLRQPHEVLLNPNNFSYCFNTDGFRISKTSSSEAWPVYLTINELPPTLRRRYRILAGVYVDKKHPDMNMLLTPFVHEANLLSRRGVTWRRNGNDIVSRFIPTVLTVDSKARSLLMNMTTDAGIFACLWCYDMGITVDDEGVAYDHRKYPVQNVPSPLRNHGDIINAMYRSFEEMVEVLGFKGLSAIMNLDHVQLPCNVVVDALHNFFLGLAKKHTQFIRDGVHRNPRQPFYLSPEAVAIVNGRLKNIRSPKAIERPPRPLSESAFWTGAEWRSWLLYYSLPCLAGILPQQHLNHLSLLSHGVFLLSTSDVTEEDIITSERLFLRYRERCQQYFGVSYMVYNLHILSHVPNCVRNWGPVWTHNTIDFETLNGEMKRKVKGPTDAAEQIVTRYLLEFFLLQTLQLEDVSDITKHCITQMMGYSNDNAILQAIVIGNATFRGTGTVEEPNNEEHDVLLQSGFQCHEFHRYSGVKVRRFHYRVKDNSIRTDDSGLYHSDEEIGIFQSAVWFTGVDGNRVAGIFVKVCQQLDHVEEARHVVRSLLTNTLKFLTCDAVQSPAVKVEVGEAIYTSPLPNNIEMH